MEKSKVDHRQKVENIKQEHQSDMKTREHKLELQLATLSSNTELGKTVLLLVVYSQLRLIRHPALCLIRTISLDTLH